jgi:predicted GNAT family acetyltransferase
VPRDVVERALAGSLNIGVYDAAGAQVAYARAVTDRATFAWISDVFVLESHRGHGLGKFVVSTLLEHPDLQGLRRVMLATADAHELYRAYGFDDLADPSRMLVVQQNPATLYGGQRAPATPHGVQPDSALSHGVQSDSAPLRGVQPESASSPGSHP